MIDILDHFFEKKNFLYKNYLSFNFIFKFLKFFKLFLKFFYIITINLKCFKYPYFIFIIFIL